MTKETMTIHRALAELKTIETRIIKAIDSNKFVVANKHSNEKINGMLIPAYKDMIKANYNKAVDLMNRRDAIKRAVVLSNAQTIITVGGKEYTVAEAIDMKNHSIQYKMYLKNNLVSSKAAADREMANYSGENLERKAEQFILNTIQAQPKDSKMTVDSEAMKALRKDYINNNAYDLIDPLNVMNLITSFEDEINDFETEIDSALSVSNAITIITVEY